MRKVQQMVEVGVSLPTAIKEALQQNGLPSITAFAEKYSLPVSSTTEGINGTRVATTRLIAALAEELGGDPAEWRQLLPHRLTGGLVAPA